MHTKFTLYGKRTVQSAFLVIIGLILGVSVGNAQTPWSGVYGNEWLTGKYGQEWLKISVSQKGIHKVTLPANFQNKANQLHLYHRGVEVALTSASNTEIEFYGVPNDGASDALLYRPFTGVRSNPYYSIYSDVSAYFLSFSGSTTKLAFNQSVIPASGSPESYHLQRDLKVYTESDTYAGSDNLAIHSLDQSFLIEGKGRSSKAYYRKSGATPSGNPIFAYPFQLKNLTLDPNKMPLIEVLLNGRTFTNNKIKASIGKTAAALTDYPGLIEFSDFIPYKKQYTINTSSDIDNGTGQGHFQLESTQITDQNSTTGLFSVTYIRLIYPQAFNMSGVSSATFNLLPTPNPTSNVSILNAPANARIYDITDADNPRLIPGSYNGTTLNTMVERNANVELNLLVTSETKNDDVVSPVEFTSYSPSAKDYLIITNETLFASANSYAAYRESSAGGSYKTLVVKIKDIYNQFNYGEPSPVAIRRFSDYMIHSAPRAKHNLLLIGSSTTISAKLFLNRELNEEIPTIGYPGSDVLLVEGLAVGMSDIPTIPVGRISATTPTQVDNYLEKITTYEGQFQQSTRKKVLHINGGLYSGETGKFAGYLSDYAGSVTNDPFKGTVVQKIKGATDFGYPSNNLDISGDINAGVGMLTYFGHGSSHYTDNNIGYVTDPSRNYNNTGKYPVMYFNGCGVGNIFNGGLSPFPTSPLANQMSLSSDWLLAEKKGAIAIVANSYYAFETSSKNYIGALYNGLFKSDAERQTIGQIHKNAAQRIISGMVGARVMASDYDIASNHQSLLLGDPALTILNLFNPLPVELISFQAKLVATEQVGLEWKTAWEKGNSHFLLERSYNAKDFEVIGWIEGKGDANTESVYSFLDKDPYPGENYYRLVQVDKSVTENSTEGETTFSRIISIKIPNTSQLIVLPNPTTDKVIIRLQTKSKIESWDLINIQGQYLKANGKGEELNLTSYPAGEYVLKVRTVNGDVYRRKLVKN